MELYEIFLVSIWMIIFIWVLVYLVYLGAIKGKIKLPEKLVKTEDNIDEQIKKYDKIINSLSKLTRIIAVMASLIILFNVYQMIFHREAREYLLIPSFVWLSLPLIPFIANIWLKLLRQNVGKL